MNAHFDVVSFLIEGSLIGLTFAMVMSCIGMLLGSDE